ncbi:MAG TPA: TIGR04283 family arsenosugar biosynthesis glycosyltransferase [Candidatus Udaeobacter sp.]|nr:TIGR04283 family arsenosugar biosynthesis glycosyltransferase [Candidatus Udaeobacter sp.]
MRISVVIPVLNEEKSIGPALTALQSLAPDELIVIDGGSTDRSREICESLGVTVISAPSGRGRQMNHGARRATGDILLFLHADTRLPLSAFDDVRSALRNPACVGGRFDLELDDRRWMLRVIGAMISLRSRLTKVATGDQAIFVRREMFEKIGGYPEIPLMEDVAFSRAMKHVGKVACLRSRVITSARRWQTEGVWRTMLKMWILKSLYLLGVEPARLTRYYGDAR